MHFFFGWSTRLHREKNVSTLDLTGKNSFHRGKIKSVLITDVRQDYVKRLTGPSTVFEAGRLNAGWIMQS